MFSEKLFDLAAWTLEAVLRLLGEATAPKTRTELRVALRVRNERLGDALERLGATIPVPVPLS